MSIVFGLDMGGSEVRGPSSFHGDVGEASRLVVDHFYATPCLRSTTDGDFPKLLRTLLGRSIHVVCGDADHIDCGKEYLDSDKFLEAVAPRFVCRIAPCVGEALAKLEKCGTTWGRAVTLMRCCREFPDSGTDEELAQLFAMAPADIFTDELVVGGFGGENVLSLYLQRALPKHARFLWEFARRGMSREVFQVNDNLLGRLGAKFLFARENDHFLSTDALHYVEIISIAAHPWVTARMVERVSWVDFMEMFNFLVSSFLGAGGREKDKASRVLRCFLDWLDAESLQVLQDWFTRHPWRRWLMGEPQAPRHLRGCGPSLASELARSERFPKHGICIAFFL